MTNEKAKISKRFQTMPLSKIDGEFLATEITDQWKKSNQDRDEMLSKQNEWTANWRDLNIQRSEGPWENSSDFHIPLTLINGKAIHARLWQLFSDLANFFGVNARREVFQDREIAIREFMAFILMHHANSKNGVKDVLDEWLWDNVFEGSGYLKLYNKREVHQYMEVVPRVSIDEVTTFDPNALTGKTETIATADEVEELREEIVETPHIKRILMEDITLPIGEGDPQTARFVNHRVFMTNDELKSRAAEGKFDEKAVAEALKHRATFAYMSNEDEVKRTRQELDGYCDSRGYSEEFHVVMEWYGKAYVEKEIDLEKDDLNVNKMPQEIVVWVHQASKTVLGWTYLYRISPSGIRPIFKADFIKFPDRAHGVGVAEVMAPIQQAVDATYNLRQDSGILASTACGFYRASSGLKPDKIRIEPGMFHPVDDPQQDVRIIQFPFLAGYGNQEEDRLVSYGERILTISDINLGRTPDKVGVYRTASGANDLQSQSGIQLEIHFDRIARTISKLLQALFQLARETIPAEFYYRITGENGEPIFGKINRNDLKGEYDFDIFVDVLGESRTEGQQKATLLMQTLLNPAFMQTGIVAPKNLYELARNFLLKNRVKRIDNFLSKPQDYSGEIVTPAERVYRIVVGAYDNPPLADTVRLDEDHEAALKYYNGFEKTDQYGLLVQPAQLLALDELKKKHQELLAAQQAGGNPNMAGMQTPRDGFAPLPTGPAPDQGPLGAPIGEANGPVL